MKQWCDLCEDYMPADMRQHALALFPVDGKAITCGKRTDMPRKQRRHDYIPMGDDFTNKAEEGIVQVPVWACGRCGRDKRE